MATINVSSRHLNQNKREAEAITVTYPSVSNQGGGRGSNSGVTYYQFGDDLTAYVVPANSIIQKVYLIVEEAFAASAKVTVKVGSTSMFAAVAADATGMTTSATQDILSEAVSTVTATFSGGTGDLVKGKCRVVIETIPFLEGNGRYSSYPHANDDTQSR